MMSYILSFCLALAAFCAPAAAQTCLLTLATWNVRMLPLSYPASQLGRVDSVASLVRGSGADVVCLQEVFSARCARILDSALSAEYPYRVACRKTPGKLGTSGLVAYSKHPVKNASHMSYKSAHGVDALADKGAVSFTVCLPGSEVTVVNTHAQSGDGRLAAEARMSQLAQLAEHLRSAQDAVIAGDLNCQPLSRELLSLVCTVRADGFDVVWPTYEHVTLDYVLTTGAYGADTRVVRTSFSDHNMLVSYIYVK